MSHWSIRLRDTIPEGFSGFYSKATTPTAIEIPIGRWGWWYDTSQNKLYVARNDSGIVKVTEASQF